MKIDTHNSFDLRFSSISDINRLIAIDYYRLQSILSIIEFHRLGTPGLQPQLGLSRPGFCLIYNEVCTYQRCSRRDKRPFFTIGLER